VFNTGAPEIMEINGGKRRLRIKGETEWKIHEAGQSLSVPCDSHSDIETIEMLDYVCHSG
jgi:uncharacterized protein YaiE (UPF0345 family)